jgi:hypothetical protein|tara:strand:- start:855 stop:1154 length:300 start_codon:yes stop_codon:yes gene_type:complete
VSTISLPLWSVPLGVAFVTLAVSWGVLQANTSFASEERDRIATIANEAARKAQDNGQAQAVTEAKVQAIVESLARQEKIQEQTNEQIQALVATLLAQQN